MQWRPVENFPNANVDWLRTRYVSLILRQYFWLLFVQFSKAYIWRRRSKIKANILLLCLVGREIQLIRMNKGNLWFIGVANIRSPRCEHFTNLHGKGKHEPHVDVVWPFLRNLPFSLRKSFKQELLSLQTDLLHSPNRLSFEILFGGFLSTENCEWVRNKSKIWRRPICCCLNWLWGKPCDQTWNWPAPKHHTFLPNTRKNYFERNSSKIRNNQRKVSGNRSIFHKIPLTLPKRQTTLFRPHGWSVGSNERSFGQLLFRWWT